MTGDDLPPNTSATMTDAEWREHVTRPSPDFPSRFGQPLGDRWSEVRAVWVRQCVEALTRQGREYRLRQLSDQGTTTPPGQRLAELEERVRRFH